MPSASSYGPSRGTWDGRRARSWALLRDRSRGFSGALDGRFDVVVDADRGQQSVRAAFVDPDSRLGRQVVAAPAVAVVPQDTPGAVVGDGAVLEADAAARAEARGEERAELARAAVGVVRADGLVVVPVWGEGADDRVAGPRGERGLVAADDITGVLRPGLEDGG